MTDLQRIESFIRIRYVVGYEPDNQCSSLVLLAVPSVRQEILPLPPIATTAFKC